MKTAIIGVKGVGMAHAIACETLGWDVVALLDTDPEAVKRYSGPTWVNEWGPYRDEVAPKSRPAFSTSINDFLTHKADLLIIATPTAFHLPYLNQFGMRYDKVLVEKPLGFKYNEIENVGPTLRKRTFVSHEWLCHPDLPAKFYPPVSVKWGHKYLPIEDHKRNPGVVWDLGCHAIAMGLHTLANCSLWSGITANFEINTPTEARITLNIPEADSITIHAAYKEVGPGEVDIQDAAGHAVLNWADLFPIQLQRLADGTHPGTFALAAKVCQLLSEGAPFNGT
jgi:hypothetical protein